MASAGWEEACREIRGACGHPRRLGLLLAPTSPAERQQIRAAYRASFGEDLAAALRGNPLAAGSGQEDELRKLLYLWALEPAERDAVVAREAVEGGATVAGYRALVEVFTRRKQDQLFFTKQAYLARFRRNLDQDMVTEPSHPYQRLLVALAASRKSHHDEPSHHIAKCDARRLHDTKNAGAGSVVDEAVILEMFSKRSIPQLRLAFCSYKHIYGHDYTKASRPINCIMASLLNDSVLRLSCNNVCLLQRSMQCAATDKRLVTRAILGSDDVGIDEIRSAFKSCYGRNLADFIRESLPQSDYRDFLVAVARGSAAS
ncbi:annexin D8-like [Panicum miliaceum]|uniref:Annexin D8-like n=1 Tax=Panicum miliaceum TaxID=4540 RepID=A0A3L6T6L0_PANMI|nr:annexin D8-like [Panicum miliaceum]